MLKRLPTLTKFYGIQPADLDSFTFREIFEYNRQLDEYLAKQED